jgi:hypothetical protein|tara:strand:+ start:1822 stop:2226 length:405 start_codon:yes stop_codon:yes gene_type:complete
MNRRNFFGSTIGAVVGFGAAAAETDREWYERQKREIIDTIGPRGPFSIEIVSPPQEAVRELPLFDNYKQAENFAQARMNILRQQVHYDQGGDFPAHEAGCIKVWSADSKVVYECAWGETWTTAHSYVTAEGRYH